jgi:polyisoprenoid-binding protein YceI
MNGGTRRVAVVVIAAVLAALLLAGGYGIWYLFLRPAGPAAIDVTSTALPSSLPSSAPLTGGIDGTWQVDTSIGSAADLTDSTFVGYRVQEQLAGIGANTAVGRTSKVTGSLTIAGSQVSAVTIEADLTTLSSDDPNRDRQLGNQGIQTNQFPTATFKLTSPLDLGSVPTDGKAVSVTAKGDLTLHGVTKSVEVPLKATLSGSVIVVEGSLPITFADYGIDKPNSFKVLSIDDHGTMELQLFFTKG